MTSGKAPIEPGRRRILIAEDEEHLRSLLKLSLGRAYEVQTVSDGLAAVQTFEANPSEMVILAIMMPRMDGLTACEEIRRRSDVPIIMLTALGGVEDVVKGFNLGADDYITKPFTFKELTARIEAVFRRLAWMREPHVSTVVVNGEVRIDADSRQVWMDDEELHLTPIEFQVLYYLISRPGQSVSKENLFKEVWGYDFVGGTNLVEVGIRRLREKIETDPSNPELIQTVRGVGYRFRAAPVPKT